MTTKAIYPGSFDPFTNGHLDICKKASRLFNEVYIVIAINTKKNRSFNGESVKDAIEKDLADYGITNCTVCIYDGLVAKFAEEIGAQYMIRGLRNNLDYGYEENIAEVNKLINPLMEYVYFRADNVAISSSMVKELYSYNQDISKYVPHHTLMTICNYEEVKQDD